MMSIVFRCLCLAATVATIQARLTEEEMRRALNMSPAFSHQRDRAIPVPQNVNIHLPVNDPDMQTNPMSQNFPPHGSAGSMAGGIGLPMAGPGMPMVDTQPPPPRRRGRGNGGRGRAQRKSRRRMRQSAAPVNMPAEPAMNSMPNDRFVNNNNNNNNMRPMTSQNAQNFQGDCSFQIPSFLMPDPVPADVTSGHTCPSFLLPGPSINPNLVNLMVEHWTGINGGSRNSQLNQVKDQISQMEFEQKCLVPALNAHVNIPACRSRELTVYLEWLLYLRQRLFNI